MSVTMSCLHELSFFSYIDVVFVDGRGHFRCPEMKFENILGGGTIFIRDPVRCTDQPIKPIIAKPE